MGFRITNKMMTNNTLSNVNRNKWLLDKSANQVETQQKISRASEDPVIAVRALRLKGNISTLDQYISKNVPDAESWLEFSETALNNIYDCTQDLYNYSQQLGDGGYDLTQKKAILESMQSIREQMYAEGNADYCGRSLFTGFKTNLDLAFGSADTKASYKIKETFSGSDVESIKYVSGSVDVNKNDILISGSSSYDQNSVVDNTLYRLRLSYADLTAIAGEGLTYSSSAKGSTEISVPVAGSENGFVKVKATYDPSNGNVTCTVEGKDTAGDPYTASYDPTTGKITVEDASNASVGAFDCSVDPSTSQITVSNTINVTSVSLANKTQDDAYIDAMNNIGGVTLIEETGELILGAGVYQSLQNAGNDSISFSYEKTGFAKGELRPEHYFDCTNLNNGYVYKNENNAQDISYMVNFNQSIVVNTEAKNVFDHSIGRDMDDLMNALSDVIKIEEKIVEFKKLQEDELYADKSEYIASIIEACEKELTYANNKLESLSNQGITNYSEYGKSIKSAVTDIGSKRQRVELTKTRAEDQLKNLQTLESDNIGMELSDALIKQESAQLAYDASLSSASKIVSHSLLDFL